MPPVPKPKRQRRRHFIREWREDSDLTQAQAAERIGMSRENYGKVERNLIPYDQDFLELAAEAFSNIRRQVTPADLLMRNPADSEALWSLWDQAKQGEREQIVDLAKVVVGRRAN